MVEGAEVKQVVVVLCCWHPSPLWVPFHLVPFAVIVKVLLHLLNVESVAGGDIYIWPTITQQNGCHYIILHYSVGPIIFLSLHILGNVWIC